MSRAMYEVPQKLRARIFSTMPVGRPVTANDVFNLMSNLPRGVNVRDIKNNLAVMARLGGAVERATQCRITIYTRSE